MKEGFSSDVEVVNELGLHARAAAKVAEVASRARAGVWLIREGRRADAASIIDILTLACSKGTTITVRIEDKTDAPLLEAIVRLFAQGFEED